MYWNKDYMMFRIRILTVLESMEQSILSIEIEDYSQLEHRPCNKTHRLIPPQNLLIQIIIG